MNFFMDEIADITHICSRQSFPLTLESGVLHNKLNYKPFKSVNTVDSSDLSSQSTQKNKSQKDVTNYRTQRSDPIGSKSLFFSADKNNTPNRITVLY